MSPPRFTLRQMMLATGAFGVAFWASMASSEFLLGIAPLIVCLMAIAALCIAIAMISRAPFWLRIMIEAVTLVFLLAFSSWLWQPAHFTASMARCDRVARHARTLAEGAEDPHMRAILDREASWFSRRATSLRWNGFWRGLLEGPSSRDRYPLSNQMFIQELAIDAEIERHERSIVELE